MSRRVLIVVTLLAALAAATSRADAGIRIRYSSGSWRVGGYIGSYGYPYYYGRSYYHGYYPYTSYYSPLYVSVPTRTHNLPYIPPGTIYTIDTPSRYGYYPRYPYSYYPYYSRYPYAGNGFAASYLATAPGVGPRTVTTTSSPSAPVVHNNTRIVVNVTSPAPQPPRVVVQDNSWKRDLWRVSSGSSNVTAAETTDTGPTTTTNAAPTVPASTQKGHLASLVRGNDDQRREAAKQLKRFNNVKVVAALTDALAKDGDDDVREEAARSLGTMLARNAHDALWKAAREDTDRDVREAARESALKVEAYYNIKPAK